jgi:hypothetical protein
MDTLLHLERTGRADHRAPWGSLPEGVFVSTDSGPAVVVGDHLTVWDRDANMYRDKLPRPASGAATVLTPPSTLEILRAGFSLQIDNSAR